MTDKIRVATTSLAGCFGCHMSLLDIDDRLIQLAEVVAFDRSPLTDIKSIGPCDVGIIEGGVCNAENVEVLRDFRRHCKVLVAMGACALNGGVPAMRNNYPLTECLEECYLNGIGADDPQIPGDEELPLLLDKVRPLHEVVKIDYFLPGCPPDADTIWRFFQGLLTGEPVSLTDRQIHYD